MSFQAADIAAKGLVRNACVGIVVTAGAVVGPTLDIETARDAVLLINCSITNAGDSVTAIVLQDSANGTTWATAETGTNITNGSAFDGVTQVVRCNYLRRYVRLNYTGAVAGITSVFAVTLVAGDQLRAPATTVST